MEELLPLQYKEDTSYKLDIKVGAEALGHSKDKQERKFKGHTL